MVYFVATFCFVCVNLLHFALSVPVSASISTGLGAGTGTVADGASGASGLLTDGVAAGNAAAGEAMQAANQLAASSSSLLNGVAEAAREAADSAAALAATGGSGLNGASSALLQQQAARLAAGADLAMNAAKIASQFGASLAGGSTGGGLLASLTVPAQVARAVANGVIDLKDMESGAVMTGIRPFALGGSGLVDAGLGMVGVRPVVTPMVQGGWQAGENGRQYAFDLSRQFVNSLGVPALPTPGSGSAGTAVGASASVQAA